MEFFVYFNSGGRGFLDKECSSVTQGVFQVASAMFVLKLS